MNALRTLSKIGNENRTEYKKPPKVKRYWPGKAPSWAPKAEEDEELLKEQAEAAGTIAPISSKESKAKVKQIIEATRAQQISSKPPADQDGGESSSSSSDSNDEDEEALAARRARMRARAQARREEEEKEELERDEKADESSSEYESVYETDSEDEAAVARPVLFQPVFRKKAERDTLTERDHVDAEYERLEATKAQRLEERAQETRQIVREEIQKDDDIEAGRAMGSDDEMPNDTDGVDEDEEFENWKLRELRRIKRDKAEREAEDFEQAEIERRRNMTDAEREAEDAKNKAKNKDSEANNPKFMQKYYHKGAFFMDEAEKDESHIYNRNFQAATGCDKVANMKELPKVMQVRNFGLAGRTKYTHLKDQDTTQRDDAWNEARREQSSLSRLNYDKKMGGMGNDLNRPSKKGGGGKDKVIVPQQSQQ
eukprot:TRINITY_DN2733_c0_g1_i1.p1 TRINITY_DN2733_c0_g1~~TRINITY_DN2733_c0_g1_i1.p1  ORF type:complete len:427 (+),score=106.00 TRINITY_DN2733_c0_g1_i1:414-1694(+)